MAKRLYVIKKNKRYIKNIELDNSYTADIDKAATFCLKHVARDYTLSGEIIIKVQKNKHGNLVEVY